MPRTLPRLLPILFEIQPSNFAKQWVPVETKSEILHKMSINYCRRAGLCN